MKSKGNRRERGFTLLVVIVLLFFCTIMMLGVLTLSKQEERLSEFAKKRHLTVNVAFSASRIALARLQSIAGTDAVITSKAPNDNIYSVAWNVKNTPAHFPEKISKNVPVPLISGNNKSKSTDIAKIQADCGNMVSAPWEYVGDNLRFAYAIFDESLKLPLIPPLAESKKARALNDEREQLKRQLINQNKNLEKKPFRKSKSQNASNLAYAQYDPSYFFSKQSNRHVTAETASLDTFGIIADWPRNKLKEDLSRENSVNNLFPDNFFTNWNNAFSENIHSGILVADSEPKTFGPLGLCYQITPIVIDLRLHIGFFNSRTDGQHRARFHVSAKIWNPYAFPILGHADGNLGLIDFSDLPTFAIRNQNTDTGFSVNLSDFPTGRFGLVRQTPSDKTFNVHCKIFDTSNQGFGENPETPIPGLHPGEVYSALFPNPLGQPEGLSRITGGATWKFQKSNNPNKPPYQAVGGRWFHNEHKINIFSLPSLNPGEIVFRHYSGSFPQSISPEDYSSPIFKFENVQLPHVDFIVSGMDYNRQKSGDYDITQANLVYRIRLKSEDPNTMKELFENIELRNGIFDFSNPIVSNAFEITAHTGTEARNLSNIEDDETQSYFFDRFVNKHATGNHLPAFSSIQLYDLPTRNQISVGTLRLFHQSKLPPNALGRSSDKVEKLKINQIFDRYFFSSETRSDNAITIDNPLLRKKSEKHSTKEFQSQKEIKFAEECLIRGPFNINTTSEAVWEFMLTNTFENWKQYSGGKNQMPWNKDFPAQTFENVFFTRPFTAHIFSPDGKIFPLSDLDLAKTTLRSRLQFLLTQGLRSIPNEKISLLSKYISKKIDQRLKERAPFQSIAEFIDSGIIERGINESGLNEIAETQIPKWFPNSLRQEHLIEKLCLQATPRGDTFKIIAKAEHINPITQRIESKTTIETIVQRTPDLFDEKQNPSTEYEECNAKNRSFGRRFKVVKIRVFGN